MVRMLTTEAVLRRAASLRSRSTTRAACALLGIRSKFPRSRNHQAKGGRLSGAKPPKPGQHYVCVNPLCRSEIQVIRPSMETSANPECSCGAEMKKPYRTPVFRLLYNQPPEFGFLERKRRGSWPMPLLPC
jgi:hypothetical protein